MHGNVFSGVQLFWIIEVPDKRGPNNRGCTVFNHQCVHEGYSSCCVCALGDEAICCQGSCYIPGLKQSAVRLLMALIFKVYIVDFIRFW